MLILLSCLCLYIVKRERGCSHRRCIDEAMAATSVGIEATRCWRRYDGASPSRRLRGSSDRALCLKRTSAWGSRTNKNSTTCLSILVSFFSKGCFSYGICWVLGVKSLFSWLPRITNKETFSYTGCYKNTLTQINDICICFLSSRWWFYFEIDFVK